MRKFFLYLAMASTSFLAGCADYLPLPEDVTLVKKSGTAVTSETWLERGEGSLEVLAVSDSDTLEITVQETTLRPLQELNRMLDENPTFRIPLTYFDGGVKFYFNDQGKGVLPSSEFYFD